MKIKMESISKIETCLNIQKNQSGIQFFPFNEETYLKSLKTNLIKKSIKKITKPISLKKSFYLKKISEIFLERNSIFREIIIKPLNGSNLSSNQNLEISKNFCLFNYLKNGNEKIYDVKYKVKLMYFGKIMKLLVKLFRGQDLKNEDLSLDKKSKKLLILILKKKFQKIGNLRRNNFERDLMSNNYENVILTLNNLFKIQNDKFLFKRREEENKLIYKFVLKKLKTKFFNQNNLEHKKKNEEFFFQNFSEKNSQKNNLYNKTISEKNYNLLNITKSNTLKIVASSKNLKSEIIFFIKNLFLKLYEKKIDIKFYNMFLLFELNSKSYQESEKKLLEFFSVKNNIKFPWTLFELKIGLNNFIRMLNSF